MAILQTLGKLISAAWPFGKQRIAERRAGASPESTSPSIFDRKFQEAIARLGAEDADAPAWKKALVGAQALLVRPETFSKPIVRNWLSIKQVTADLRAEVEARLNRREPLSGGFDRLVTSYTTMTGEDARYAEAAIRIATAFLHASLEAGARDAGLAAVVQATSSASTREVMERLDGIERTVKLSGNEYILTQISNDARNALDRIIVRRATPGMDTLGDLRNLCGDFDEGRRYAAVYDHLKREALLWLGRMEIASGDVKSGMQTFEQLERQGVVIPPFVMALADLERGQLDEAIRRVRDKRDPDSRTAMFHILRKARSVEEALSYVATLDTSDSNCLTILGWNNYCVTLALVGRMEDAAALLEQLPSSLRAECTHLEYLYAVSQLLPLVPTDRRGALVTNGFSAIAEHLLEGSQAAKALSAALRAAEGAHKLAEENGDTVVAERCLSGMRSLQLVDPLTREQSRATIREQMLDPEQAVRLIALARMFEIEFDSGPLEGYLAKAEGLGGLSDEQLRAKLYLFNHPSRAAELLRLFDQHWDRLSLANSAQAMVVMKTQALAQLGDLEEAEGFLEGHKAEMPGDVLERLRLMIQAGRGGDPSEPALQLFERTRAIEDLVNLTQLLAQRRQWRRLLPFAHELFRREPNCDSAMLVLRCLQHVQAPPSEISAFLESTAEIAEQRDELLSARAWALLRTGRHEDATKLKDELIKNGKNPIYLSLEIAIAVQTGDWESLPSITAKAWEQRHLLEPESLLVLAKLAGVTSKEQALQLAKEAVARAGDSPNVLIGAHSVAVAAGRDDLGMPWVARAAELSKSGGPIQTFSHRELIEFMKSNSEGWKKKNDLYREAQVPSHMAASMFNAPLIQLMIGTSRRNANESDARRRQPVPFRSGKRTPMDANVFSRVAFDITTLYVLCDLGLLRAALESFEVVYVSPRLMETLLNEREKVAFHQPSRVTEVKPMHSLLTAGRLGVVSESASPSIAGEVGEEAARLIQEAKLVDGVFVHPGVLYKVSSFMEQAAELGELGAVVVDPIDVVDALREEGLITQMVHDSAVEALIHSGCARRSAVGKGVPVLLDGLAVQYLNQSRMLIALLNSGRSVYVHEDTVDEWRALLETEPTRDDMVAVIDEIRLLLRQGIVGGTVRLLPQCRRDRDQFGGTALEPLLDLLDDISQVEAVFVDDRMVGGNATVSDSANRSLPILSSLDIAARLIARGALEPSESDEILHRLRAGTMFCVPLSLYELNTLLRVALIEQGKLVESAELRRLREYLQRLFSSDVLCTPADLEYMDDLWRVGLKAISDLWAAETCQIEDAEAKSDWIAAFVIPPLEIGMRFAEGRTSRIDSVASGRLAASLVCAASSRQRRRKYYEWLERSALADLLPANGTVIDVAADQTAKFLAIRSKEIGNELSRRSSKDLS